MSKIEIVGPRDRLLSVLGTVRQSGVLQIDAGLKESIEPGVEAALRPQMLDGRVLAERLFLEDLKLNIDRLLELLPKVPTRESYLSPERAVNAIASLVKKHLDTREEQSRRRGALQGQIRDLSRYEVFLATVESLTPREAETGGLDVIAVEVRDPEALEHLTKVAGRMLLGADVRTARTEDGGYIGLLTTEKELSGKLKESLRHNEIPEVSLPPFLEGLSLSEKIAAVRARHEELKEEVAAIDTDEQAFARSWRGTYERTARWIEERLSLMESAASLYETENCFVLFGWIPTAELEGLRKGLAEAYENTVVVEEKEILKHDLDRVPVALRNPSYFQPFELLVGLLPLPRYTSFDPTPFIGIFFPLFFGMILGDVAYGIVLLLAALGLIVLAKEKKIAQQAGRILFVAALYTIVFGFLYGECLGDFGVEILGLPHGCVDRRTSIMPMLYFAVAVGAGHVVVGMVLGFLSALRGERTREAVSRLVSIILILCIIGILASYFAPVAALARKPLIVVSLIAAPVLLVTGGLLAPFELLKYLGNIISYARIMAVGLTSVLLAYVANNLAGAAGSIWVGAAVAVLLHTFNILLGVFAPTLHALRLHYVEFFSKFVEPGGKQFKPFKRT
jgi:V/A-type H+-transporting ATPase subunit I